jgi:hypothetical protein
MIVGMTPTIPRVTASGSLLCERVLRHIPLHELGLNAPVARIFAAMSRDIIVAFSMLLVCLTALVMTRSRAGVVLSLGALVLALIAYFYRYLQHPRAVLLAILASGAVALVVLYALGGGDGQVRRSGPH